MTTTTTLVEELEQVAREVALEANRMPLDSHAGDEHKRLCALCARLRARAAVVREELAQAEQNAKANRWHAQAFRTLSYVAGPDIPLRPVP
jgi:hypothetical protein